jgi:ADP-heptose:LPS heptosyltransferase
MQRRILIIRQDRIGDAVLATALPREIKNRWPNSHVGVLVRGYTKPLFENNPFVDVILTDDHTPETRKATFWPMVRELRRHRFTHALMLLPEARINYMTFCAGIPFRVGHGIILFHALTLARPVMTRKFRKGRHEAEYSLDLARSIGVKTENATPEIHLTAAERNQSKSLASHWGDKRRVIGLHATSGQSAPNWEPEAWAELANILRRDDSLQIVVTDNVIPEALKNLEGLKYPNVGSDLREAMVNLGALDLLVSASTGPMHMAAALKVRTLSLFCPLASCEPALWGPLGNEAAYVLPEEEYCRDRCPGNPHDCRFHGSRLASPKELARLILAQ